MGGPHTANGMMAWPFFTPGKQNAEACRNMCGSACETVWERDRNRNAYGETFYATYVIENRKEIHA